MEATIMGFLRLLAFGAAEDDAMLGLMQECSKPACSIGREIILHFAVQCYIRSL